MRGLGVWFVFSLLLLCNAQRGSVRFLQDSTEPLCLEEDRLEISWVAEVPRLGNTYAIWGLAVLHNGERVQRIQLDAPSSSPISLVEWEEQQGWIQQMIESYEETVPVIGCEQLSEWDSDWCEHGWPRLKSIQASPGYGVGSTFTVTFDRATDQPSIETEVDLEKIIQFSASIGSQLTGKWLDPKTLQIIIVNETGRVDYHDQGLSASLVHRPRKEHEKVFASLEHLQAANTTSVQLEGTLSLKFEAPGNYSIALFVTDPDIPLSETVTMTVIECAKTQPAVLVHTPDPEALENKQPYWHLKEQVVLEDSHLLLPRLVSNGKIARSPYDHFSLQSWSLSFWIYLSPETLQSCSTVSNQHYRALIYHGQGKGHETGFRTPSLWLLPGDNRLALRISTEVSPDIGVDSDKQLDTGRWVHVAIVCTNTTSDLPFFSAKVFADGKPMIDFVHKTSRVLAGPGNLHFGHDPWNPGPRALVREIKVFPFVLSRLDILREMRTTMPLSSSPFVSSPSLPSSSLGVCPESDPTLNDSLFKSAFEAESSSEKLRLLHAAADDSHAESLFELVNLQPNRLGSASLNMLQQAASTGHARSLHSLALWPRLMPFLYPKQTESWKTQANNFIEQLEFAALHGSIESKLILANEFMLQGKCRASVYYFASAAGQSFREHTTSGHQPMVEMQELSDFVEEKGEQGEDDEMIQYQIHQAEQGNVDAMYNLGGLYYWGARGLPRDQERAFRYFERAAATGHAGAMTACGNMLLKGEGVSARNRTLAMDYYEQAAAKDNLEALNGLGFLYFFGNEGVERNVSKALEYFEKNLRDGDSLYNAAHIYFHEDAFRDIDKARQYLVRAATEFGSFSATHMLGELFLTSDLSSTGCQQAQKFYRSAALRGSWGKVLREGFDAFLDRDLELSAFRYLEGAFMGYSRGAENAAWLLQEKLHTLSSAPFDELFRRMDSPMSPLQRVIQGDLLFQAGKIKEAIRAWVSASVDGDWSMQRVYRSQASYNLGIQAMQLAQWERAANYFDRAESFIHGDESDGAKAAALALRLARWRLRLSKYFHPRIANLLPNLFS